MSTVEISPSALIIAPKRSGTNYTHDVLASSFSSAVNEPLGLHNDTFEGKPNPLDPWTYSSNQHVSHEFGHTALSDDPFGSLVARSFLGWVAEGDKLLKETDFLHLGWLLASVPLKVVSITRDPRESIASFKKYQLFHKWGYAQKMRQFAQTITQTPTLDTLYGGLTKFSEFSKSHFIHQLAIYYAIAFLEIERNTKNIDRHQVYYDNLVTAPHYTFRSIMEFLGKEWSESTEQAVEARTSMLRDAGPHGTFRTQEDLTSYSDFLSVREATEVKRIFDDIGISLTDERKIFHTGLETQSENVTSSSQETEVILSSTDTRKNESNKTKQESTRARTEYPLFIAQKLVTNVQYAEFLSWLVAHRIPLSINGKPFFYNDRPQGRIRRTGDSISVESYYADHPVNFVNWLGASAYCAWVGGRLPSVKEWEYCICPEELSHFRKHGKIDESSTNIGQYYADTTPVDYFPPNQDGIYDALGNTSIWLRNGEETSTNYEQAKAGLGWNHSNERALFPNPRPYWLGTAGLGIRPVFTKKLGLIHDSIFLDQIRDIIQYVTLDHKQDVALTNRQLFAKVDAL